MPIDEIQSQELPLQPLGGMQQQFQQTASLQPQLRPLDDNTPLPKSTPFGSEGDTVGSLQAEARNSADNFAVNSETQKLLQNYAEKGDDSISTGHYILATLAALNGQFGPALAIQDQKRKTAFAQKIAPIITQVNNLKNRGMIDEASDLVNTAAAQASARAPELLPIIQKQLDHISQKQVEKENNKTKANALSIFIADMQPGDPRIAQGKAYIKLLSQNTPVAKETIAAIDKSMEDHTQIFNINNKLVTGRTNQATGITTQSTGTAIPGAGDLSPPVLQRVSQELGMSAANITDILGGKDTLRNGKLLKVTPEIQQQLSDVISDMQKINTGQEEQKASAPTAEVAVQLRRVLQEEGQSEPVSRLNVSLGNYKPEHIIRANEYVAKQSVAGVQYDTSKLDSSGNVAVSIDPQTFGIPKRGLSYAEAKEQGLKIIPNATMDKVQPAINAMNGLNYVSRMYADMTTKGLTGDDDYSRLDVGIGRTVQAWAGISTGQQMTIANASRAIVNRAINEIENTQTIDDASIKELRQGITGGWAEPEGPAQAVEVLKQRAMEKIGVWIGTQGITPTPQKQSSLDPKNYGGMDVSNVNPSFHKAIRATEATPDGRESSRGAMGRNQITLATATPYMEKLGVAATKENLKKDDINDRVALMHQSDLERTYPGQPDKQAAVYFSGQPNLDKRKADGTPVNDGNLTVRQYAERTVKKMGDLQVASKLATTISPPTAKSTPAEDAAYRQQRQQRGNLR